MGGNLQQQQQQQQPRPPASGRPKRRNLAIRDEHINAHYFKLRDKVFEKLGGRMEGCRLVMALGCSPCNLPHFCFWFGIVTSLVLFWVSLFWGGGLMFFEAFR